MATSDDYKVVKAIFIEWLKLPDRAARLAAGEPGTMTEFGAKHNVHRKTLHEWKNDPDVRQAVVDHGLSVLSTDDVNKIIHGLKQKAFEGNTQAAKLLLDMAGVNSRVAPEDNSEAVAGLTDEELDARLAALDDEE